MTAADALLAVMWAGLTAYVLFGGADFGGGLWDLVAGRSRPGLPQRKLIEHSIGPVWETNHVWLIFVIVLLWTGFPSVYAALAATMVIPLTLAALGIIARGAAFAFRKVSEELGAQRLFGAAFAFSSVATPFFLGTVAGGIASGRVLPGIGDSDLVTSWWNPTSVVTGVLAIAVGAYLAAVFLTRDAQRHAPQLVLAFRRRALALAWSPAVSPPSAWPSSAPMSPGCSRGCSREAPRPWSRSPSPPGSGPSPCCSPAATWPSGSPPGSPSPPCCGPGASPSTPTCSPPG